MAGDGGDKYQYQALAKRDGVDDRTPFEKQAAARFDKECERLSRTEKENKVKESAKHLLTTHTKTVDGRAEQATITPRDIGHFVNDALFKTNGKLKLSDIRNIDKFWQESKRVVKDQPHREGKNNIVYDKYEFTLRGNKLYISVKKVKKGKSNYEKKLHSITDKLK